MEAIKGTGANPMEVSKALQDAERKEMEAANLKQMEKLTRVADEIHDILIREDLTTAEWNAISNAIGRDINTLGSHLKIKQLYGEPKQNSEDRGGAGGDKEGKRESVIGGTQPGSGANEPGSTGGDSIASGQGGTGRSNQPSEAA